MTTANRLELDRRFAAVRAEARQGATTATFTAYEALFRAARDAGERDLAAACLRDLAALMAHIDEETAKALAAAALSQERTPAVAVPVATIARGPAPVARKTDLTAVPEVTVVVLGVPADASASPAIRSLEVQTIGPTRCETILVDQADATDCNEALAAARARVIVFVDSDLALEPDVLERHVQAHAPESPPFALLGQVEVDGLDHAPLAWVLEKIGLGCAHTGADARLEAAGEFLTTSHLSLPVATLRDIGGFDATLAVFSGADLGARLTAKGVRCVVDPALRARRVACASLDPWLARWRAMGADWSRLQVKHGTDEAPPSWLGDAGLEPDAVESLVSRLLEGADGHARGLAGLRVSLREIEQVLAREPERAGQVLAKIGDDLVHLVVRVMRHELTRGYVNALTKGDGPALERCATHLERGAAVLVLGDAASLPVVKVVLENLPDWGELVVAHGAKGSDALLHQLPDDRRIVRMLLPPNAGLDLLKKTLLTSTKADLFLLLDGSSVPTAAEWEAARLTLGTLPCIGACNVEANEAAPLATAALQQELSTAILAVRRDVIENEPAATGSFLERLVKRGYRLALATGSGKAAKGCVEPASSCHV